MKQIKFKERIQIHCTPEVAFDLTQDYGRRLEWDTFLKSATLVNGASQAAVGAIAYCVARNGFGMETEYVSLRRPQVAAVKMTKGPYIFRSFLGSWNFIAISDNITEITFLYSFSLHFPFNILTGAITNNLRTNVRKRLTDLKKILEQKPMR